MDVFARTRRHWAVPAATATAVLLVAAAALFQTGVIGGPTPTPTPTPVPLVKASANKIRTIPKSSKKVQTRIADGITTFLDDLYERAFLPPFPPPTPGPEEAEPASPLPTPIPRPPIGELFTKDARKALGSSDGIFRPRPDGRIFRGRVTFRGVTSLDGKNRAQTALLAVTFEASGEFEVGAPTEPAEELVEVLGLRLTQKGQLYLIRTNKGWRVAGFDLTLREREEVPPASPSPGAEAARPHRVAQARWMP